MLIFVILVLIIVIGSGWLGQSYAPANFTHNPLILMLLVLLGMGLLAGYGFGYGFYTGFYH